MVVRDACKGLEDTVALFKTEKRSIFTPPPEPAYMMEKVFNKKADRVQFVDSVAHSSQKSFQLGFAVSSKIAVSMGVAPCNRPKHPISI